MPRAREPAASYTWAEAVLLQMSEQARRGAASRVSVVTDTAYGRGQSGLLTPPVGTVRAAGAAAVGPERLRCPAIYGVSDFQTQPFGFGQQFVKRLQEHRQAW